MTEEVHKYEFVDEIRVCPICGYKDGFHNMFKKNEKAVRWLLVCSSCHEIFDFGLNYQG